jgi:hypothetical protein
MATPMPGLFNVGSLAKEGFKVGKIGKGLVSALCTPRVPCAVYSGKELSCATRSFCESR